MASGKGLAHKRMLAVRASVGGGQGVGPDREDRKAGWARREHFTGFQVCLRVEDLVHVRRAVHRQQVETNPTPGAEGRPKQEAGKHQVQSGARHSAHHVQQRQEEEHKQHAHHHDHGGPIRPSTSSPVGPPEHHRRDPNEEPSACWQYDASGSEHRQGAVHKQHKVDREDEHGAAVVKVERSARVRSTLRRRPSDHKVVPAPHHVGAVFGCAMKPRLGEGVMARAVSRTP